MLIDKVGKNIQLCLKEKKTTGFLVAHDWLADKNTVSMRLLSSKNISLHSLSQLIRLYFFRKSIL